MRLISAGWCGGARAARYASSPSAIARRFEHLEVAEPPLAVASTGLSERRAHARQHLALEGTSFRPCRLELGVLRLQRHLGGRRRRPPLRVELPEPLACLRDRVRIPVEDGKR
jgi:hypothetical protein